MCGQPTSCCRIALRHHLLINSANWNTCFLSLKRFIKVTEGHYPNFSACQDVLRRVDKTFKAFFGRAQRGEKAGYPRFKPRSRFDSYTFPSYGDGCKVRDNGKLYCQGIGELKV